ncbi:MAG: LytTR family transcriptional regulator DNA-binding domain-containing protein [Saonia sp.]
MKKVLVLPYFINNLNDLEYLSEGILEEIIYLLSQSSRIKTASRTTSLYIKNNPKALKQLKSEYGIDYLIEGNVQVVNGDYKIFTRLFQVDTEEELLTMDISVEIDKWTSSIKSTVNTILGILDGGQSNFTIKDEYDRTKAREYYLRGLYHWHRYTHDEMIFAISFFKKSIAENKTTAIAYSAVADCYSIIGIMGYDNPIKAFETARKFSNQAIIINNKRSESYVSAAFIDIFFDRNFEQAETNLSQALKLNKDNIKAHHVSAMNLIHKRQLDKAKFHAQKTIEKEGLAIPHFAMMIRILIYQKEYGEALKYINMALNIDRNALPIIELRGLTNLFIGRIESSIEDFTYCKDSDTNNPIYCAYLAYAYAKSGFYTESRNIESEVFNLNLKKNTGILDYTLGIIKLGLNQEKKFFTHIEKSMKYSLGLLPGEFLCNPIFDAVRGDSKYSDLLILCNLEITNIELRKTTEPSRVISIHTQTSERLDIDVGQILYIEGNDNYSKIFWKNSSGIHKKTLRTTLKNIESQLSDFDGILRCHNSYIINLNNNLVLQGNSKTSYLEGSDFPIRVPVSRSKNKLLKKIFKK